MSKNMRCPTLVTKWAMLWLSHQHFGAQDQLELALLRILIVLQDSFLLRSDRISKIGYLCLVFQSLRFCSYVLPILGEAQVWMLISDVCRRITRDFDLETSFWLTRMVSGLEDLEVLSEIRIG